MKSFPSDLGKNIDLLYDVSQWWVYFLTHVGDMLATISMKNRADNLDSVFLFIAFVVSSRCSST